MDVLHILPGKGLSGYFLLDVSLLKVLRKLRDFSAKLPNINIIEESSTKRILIEIPSSRLKLIFDDLYQRLLIIEIDCQENANPNIPIMFQSQLYTNYSEILKVFDTSYKDLPISENLNIKQYPGISVLSSGDTIEKLFIHKNNSLPLYKNTIPQRSYKVNSFGNIEIQYASGKSEDLDWNSPPESVIELLGPPDYVRYKHNETAEFFYIYSNEGIDLLFIGPNYQLKKAIMHTNFIEDILFGEYERCNFFIHSQSADLTPMMKFSEFAENPVEIGIQRHAHGFSPSQYYKVQGMVVEVLHTGYMASVTIEKA